MKTITARQVLVHLALLDGIGPVTSMALYERLGDGLPSLYHFSVHDIVAQFGISTARAQIICDGLADQRLIDYEWALIERTGISCVTIADAEYPDLLRAIHAPPSVLFFKGKPVHAHGPMVAVVGSRKTNAYGKRVIESLVPAMVHHGCCVASGGALGADGMAHEACMAAGGATVVVLGSGLLRPYPHAHKKLFERVIESGGTVMSCFSQETDPAPGNFPARNRIIAGLSSGCLVVQAASKSGALITARFALDYGREVCAVPGPIDDPLSAGCHALISQGATLIHQAEDLHEVLEKIPGIAVVPQCLPNDGRVIAQTEKKLSSAEQTIIDQCARGCGSFDELLLATGLDFVALQEYLLQLEISGQLRQTFMGTWQVL